MKKFLIIYSFIFLTLFVVNGCTSKLESKVLYKNLASGSLFINFRGEEIVVPPGKTVTVEAIQNGTYTYATTFEVPAGTVSSSASGAASGDIIIKAGTKVLVIYSSTFIDGAYTLFATISSSEDLTVGNTTSP
ncbi:MAG: hypothetical protein ABI550_01765 [Ignavibacteriaceae bacterium]